MTEFAKGDRVRVAISVLPEGGPSFPQGAEGTVTEGNHPCERFPDSGPFVGVAFDSPEIADGDIVARRLERIAESRSESPSQDDGATTPPTTSEAESGESEQPQGRVYVSGPMTGYPEYNFPAFNVEADRLRAEGWEVENPADKGIVDGWGWAEYLRYDVRVISDCTAIYTLPNWHESPGANLEMIVAQALGIEWLNPDGHRPSLAALAERVDLSDVPAVLVSDDATIGNAGEVRKVSSTGGEKGVKPERFDLLPWDALNEVARVYAFGATKYKDHNWRKGYPWGSSIAAAFRHMAAFAMGEDRDPESGLLHPAHAIFHGLSLIAWSLDRAGKFAQHDDRFILT